MKTCRKCLQGKSSDQFHKDKVRSDGLDVYCKHCKSQYVKNYYLRNSGKLKDYSKSWRKNNKDKVRQNNKTYTENLHQKFFEMYGSRCSCCGEHRKCFLVLDHVVPIGRFRKCSQSEYLKAVTEYRPDRYQVLCFNCDFLKSDGNQCPCNTRIEDIKPWMLL